MAFVQQGLFMEALPSPLSSRPERSGVEGSAVQPTFTGNVFRQSVAQWRDLQFIFPLTKPKRVAANPQSR
jgi:hypothetical protein